MVLFSFFWSAKVIICLHYLAMSILSSSVSSSSFVTQYLQYVWGIFLWTGFSLFLWAETHQQFVCCVVSSRKQSICTETASWCVTVLLEFILKAQSWFVLKIDVRHHKVWVPLFISFLNSRITKSTNTTKKIDYFFA